jgi:hypothetical protein
VPCKTAKQVFGRRKAIDECSWEATSALQLVSKEPVVTATICAAGVEVSWGVGVGGTSVTADENGVFVRKSVAVTTTS